MTDQHPLTDKDLEDLEKSLISSVMGQLTLPSDFDLARAAYDKGMEDRLDQVIKALNQCKEERYTCVEVLHLFQQKLDAMRPQSAKQFTMRHLISEGETSFSEHNAPKWLTSENTVPGSTMDSRWFWEKHVLTLEVGESIDTDFQRITRTA